LLLYFNVVPDRIVDEIVFNDPIIEWLIASGITQDMPVPPSVLLMLFGGGEDPDGVKIDFARRYCYNAPDFPGRFFVSMSKRPCRMLAVDAPGRPENRQFLWVLCG
jgi:hypothetical protein